MSLTGSWPTPEYVTGFHSINSISTLKVNEVYVITEFKIKFTQKQKALGVLTVMDKDLKEQQIWSVTMTDSAITQYKLPQLMVYGGMKTSQGGKKMHLVNFAPIPDEFRWLRDFCEAKIKGRVSNINKHVLYICIYIFFFLCGLKPM